MDNYFFAFLLLIFIVPATVFGQELPPIQLDRPDQTECPFITPKNHIQIESGLTMEKISRDESSYSLPSSLWKYGINEKWELRVVTEFNTQQSSSSKLSGLAPITIGFKTALCEETGFIPKTSFIGHLQTSQLGSKRFQTPYIAPSFRFTMQHTLSKNISLAYNLGAEWDGQSAAQTYIYTLTTGIGLTPKWGCYGELYGFLSPINKADHRADCGITYLINKDVMVDISGGFGLTDNAPNNYIALGFSFRFSTIKK